MSLAPGTRLASYEIVALLGAGGMGEVYRARVLSHDPWLTPLQGLPPHDDLLQRTRRREADAALAFARMGGPELVR